MSSTYFFGSLCHLRAFRQIRLRTDVLGCVSNMAFLFIADVTWLEPVTTVTSLKFLRNPFESNCLQHSMSLVWRETTCDSCGSCDSCDPDQVPYASRFTAMSTWAHEHMSTCTARSASWNIRHFAVESHLNANPAPRRNPWHNWAHNCSIFVGHNSSYHWAAPWKTRMPCSCCFWSTSLSPASQANWMHPSHNIGRTLSFRRARLATLQAVG